MERFCRLFADINHFWSNTNDNEHTPTQPVGSPPEQRDSNGMYIPSVCDVLDVQVLLSKLMKDAPLEIVEIVLDFAEYWPCVETTFNANTNGETVAYNNSDTFVLRSPPICAGGTLIPDAEPSEEEPQPAQPTGFLRRPRNNYRTIPLTTRTERPSRLPDKAGKRKQTALDALLQHSSNTLPEPRLLHPVRKIIWTLQSHDQGWSGEAAHTQGTYAASYTWFTAGIERPHAITLHPPPPHTSSPERPSATTQTFTPTANAIPSSELTSLTCLLSWPDQTPIDVYTPWLPDARETSIIALLPPHQRTYYTVPTTDDTFSKGDRLNHPYTLQRNVQAKRETTEHVIEWRWDDDYDGEGGGEDLADAGWGPQLKAEGRGERSADGKFVRTLERGDCVTLWAHARFPGWANTVVGAKVQVFFKI
jgi:hypothetical protein